MAVDGVLRIKGLVSVEGNAAPLAVQAVGPRVETWFVSNASRAAGLVVIGLKDMDRAAVEGVLKGDPCTS
jgi:cobalamin biosynthesis protein CobW